MPVQCTCLVCGASFQRSQKHVDKGWAKYCSKRCYGVAKTGTSPAWAKGWKIAHGYALVHMPNHPHAQAGGYVMQHRLVMEEVLGRTLLPDEVVHHINEVKDDNRPENLMILPVGIHHRLHKTGVLSVAWSIHGDACLDCGTTTRKHKALGLCDPCWQRQRWHRLHPKQVQSV